MCDCKNPHEHAGHLRQEAAVFNQFNRQPVTYWVVDYDENGHRADREVSGEEFHELFLSGSGEGQNWVI